MGVEFFPCAACGESICDAGNYITCNGCSRSYCEECHPGPAWPYSNCPVCGLQVIPDDLLLAYIFNREGWDRQEVERAYRDGKKESK